MIFLATYIIIGGISAYSRYETAAVSEDTQSNDPKVIFENFEKKYLNPYHIENYFAQTILGSQYSNFGEILPDLPEFIFNHHHTIETWFQQFYYAFAKGAFKIELRATNNCYNNGKDTFYSTIK